MSSFHIRQVMGVWLCVCVKPRAAAELLLLGEIIQEFRSSSSFSCRAGRGNEGHGQRYLWKYLTDTLRRCEALNGGNESNLS